MDQSGSWGPSGSPVPYPRLFRSGLALAQSRYHDSHYHEDAAAPTASSYSHTSYEADSTPGLSASPLHIASSLPDYGDLNEPTGLFDPSQPSSPSSVSPDDSHSRFSSSSSSPDAPSTVRSLPRKTGPSSSSRSVQCECSCPHHCPVAYSNEGRPLLNVRANTRGPPLGRVECSAEVVWRLWHKCCAGNAKVNPDKYYAVCLMCAQFDLCGEYPFGGDKDVVKRHMHERHGVSREKLRRPRNGPSWPATRPRRASPSAAAGDA